MIGNDVVDLRLAATQSNWERSGYLDKLFTRDEQRQILKAADPAKMLWLLWSMKEAAYKAENRLTGIRNYCPSKFMTRLSASANSQYCGEVHYQGRIFYTQSNLCDDMVHSIACLRTGDIESVRQEILPYTTAYLSVFNSLNTSRQLYKNKAGMPAVIHQETGQQYMASVSHHGHYLAIIYSGSLLSTD